MKIWNWYLSPGYILEEIESFKKQFDEINAIADSIIVVGNLNVHHASWPRFSREDIPRDRYSKDERDIFDADS